MFPQVLKFQSTQPKWAATCGNTATSVNQTFQSTQPKWAATVVEIIIVSFNKIFQSTQPKWAATKNFLFVGKNKKISIHAAQVGCDDMYHAYKALGGNDFNPRSPSGLRPACFAYTCFALVFQSTQPKWAATLKLEIKYSYGYISIHAAQVGCDKPKTARLLKRPYFNPRSPSGLRR